MVQWWILHNTHTLSINIKDAMAGWHAAGGSKKTCKQPVLTAHCDDLPFMNDTTEKKMLH